MGKFKTLIITGIFGGQVVNVQHQNLNDINISMEGISIRSSGNIQSFNYDSSASYTIVEQDGYIDTTESK